jgi:hypothetical protein
MSENRNTGLSIQLTEKQAAAGETAFYATVAA